MVATDRFSALNLPSDSNAALLAFALGTAGDSLLPSAKLSCAGLLDKFKSFSIAGVVERIEIAQK